MSDLKIITRDQFDAGTAQTPGMVRLAGVAPSTCGSTGIWMGEVTNAPGFRTGAHHHGDVESGIYVISGALKMRWGDRLQHEAVARAGDFIFVPAMMVHQEMNLDESQPVVAIVARGGDNIVVNVDMPDEK
jgi:uncharacterized RmlC-like cupin family protein